MILRSSRPLRYLVVGAGNTLLSYGVYCLSLFGGMPVPLASLVALVFGVTISFFSQGLVVFGNLTTGAMLRFLANWMVMYAVYVGAVTALQYAGMSPYLGGLVAFVPTTIVSYFVLRDFVFGSRT